MRSKAAGILRHIARGSAVLLLFGALLFLLYSRFLTGREQHGFSGVVTEKWIGISETPEGSKLSPTILVKTDDGVEIRLFVEAEIYARVSKSTHIRHDANGVRIEPPKVISTAETIK